jgi:hypothetical protein
VGSLTPDTTITPVSFYDYYDLNDDEYLTPEEDEDDDMDEFLGHG